MSQALKVLALGSEGIGRRQFLGRTLASLAAFSAFSGLSLSGCTTGSGRKLNIYNYSNYIAPDSIAKFKQGRDIDLVYDEFSSQDVLFNKIKLGAAYDLVVATDYMLRRFIDHRMLAEIGPGFKHRQAIIPRFQNPPWDKGLRWSVPYMWGTTGIGYNSRFVKEVPATWDALWDKRYAQHMTMLDEKRDSIGAALIHLGFSGNSCDPGELEQARRCLLAQAPLLRQYTCDYIDGLARNELWLAQAWSGDVARARQSNPDICYSLPGDGSFVFVDCWCIPAIAEHKEEAVEFLNFIMEPRNVADVTNATGYPSTIEAAKKYVDPIYLDNPLGYPPEEMLQRTVFQEDIGAKERIWDEMWADIKFRKGSNKNA